VTLEEVIAWGENEGSDAARALADVARAVKRELVFDTITAQGDGRRGNVQLARGAVMALNKIASVLGNAKVNR
jgi:hypothetical protein